MVSSTLPDELLAFLRRHVHSVEQLEILLLLFMHRDKQWSATDVSREMRGSAASASARLAELAGSGLLVEHGAATAFSYRSASDHDASVALLAATYAERRHAVIEAIFARPKESMEMFAEAFRFRRRRGDDDG